MLALACGVTEMKQVYYAYGEKVCNYSLIKFEIKRWEVFKENSIKLFTKNKNKKSYMILNVIGYTSAN